MADCIPTRQRKGLPDGSAQVSTYPSLVEAISNVGSGQWEVIALNLGLGINAIDQIKEDSRKNVARLARAIDAWIKEAKERNDATVKRLLNACDSSGIGSRAIEQKYDEIENGKK